MGRFAFRIELGICHIPTVVCGNWNNIPLGSLEAWAVAYRLLGRDKKELLFLRLSSGEVGKGRATSYAKAKIQRFL